MKTHTSRHPEDCLLTSREDFMEMCRFLRCIDNTVSVKYDGALNIVWGINPENNRFFVGTKSVFNKVKIKINYTHGDIERITVTNRECIYPAHLHGFASSSQWYIPRRFYWLWW